MDGPRNYPPRLYAEGQSNLDNKDLNHSVLLSHIDTFRVSVGENVWNEIKEHPTGIAAKIYERNIIWSAKTIHYLLCRQLRVRKNELWFLIGGKPIRFGLNEFEHVTGLTTHPLPTEPFELEIDYIAFLRELVPASAEGGITVAPTLYELMDGLDKCRAWSPQDIKRKWMGQLFLIAIGIHGLHHNSRIPLESAKRVFDDEALNNYPWGQVAFQSLVGSIKTISPTGRTYTINGLVYALQAWAYESITCFGELFGNQSDGDMCPLLRLTVIDEEIKTNTSVRVVHMIVRNDGVLYPEWPDQPEDQELDNLIQDLPNERFVPGLWDEKMTEKMIENKKNNTKKKKKKKPADKYDSQHIAKKQKVLQENDVDFDESVGNKNDEEKDLNEEEDNVSIRKLITDMAANLSSRFDNLATSMNGMSSRLEKVESDLTELNKWKDSNRFHLQDLLGVNSGTPGDPSVVKNSSVPVDATTQVKDPVNASTRGKGPVDQSPSTFLQPPMKSASSHPLGHAGYEKYGEI